ncbi:MAG: hypothetical protein KDN18_25035 [Verrucomicrobiae bacterium]|nr:hypothetical protein [Verrucomicrobiae bacterium]
MKNHPLHSLRSPSHFVSSLAAGILLFSGLPGFSREATIANGKVGPDGVLYQSTNTLGGTVSTARLAAGSYQIEVNAPGAFAGAITNDFAILVTPVNSISDDEIATAVIQSLTDDTLTARVRLADIEDAADPNNQAAVDTGFFFSLLRFPDGTTLEATSSQLTATGRVGFNGELLSAAVPPEFTLDVIRSSVGNYQITLSRPGAFINDDGHDYALNLAVVGTGVTDEIIRGNTVVTASDDEVVFRVILDDAQDTSNDNLTEPTDRTFAFAIHRLESIEGPQSSLLLGMLRFDGFIGIPLNSATSIPGGTLSGERTGPGRYRIALEVPGYFKDRYDGEFAAFPQVEFSGYADDFAVASVDVFDYDTLHIDVAVNDVETAGTNLGVGEDRDFFLVLYDARTTTQADLHIGKGPTLSRMKGDDRYQAKAKGQVLNLRKPIAKGYRYFQAVENDGNVRDRFVFRGRLKGEGKMKHFRLSGGKTNVTAAVRNSGYLAESIAPGDSIRFESRLRLPSGSAASRSKILCRSLSPAGGLTDATKALTPRP